MISVHELESTIVVGLMFMRINVGFMAAAILRMRGGCPAIRL